ncbi:DUF5053 domain-containing protein [Capnocytophaga catalasegens]|uniref:DUF5053 domain-containing protein n=1 Tax=Capnocytophaga catalasegens TaxID=1004260 RepID=A0AAV5ATB6_9FLAO|nr:DUF5053 domain-containing protein [Capnocytophaga catalasegens]GIZ15759.1 DUF5053 domain-containing protein [Capnocytophaga catalasegens]GJM49500.1 DUF5053 domain-containing protein [Capnocytophaga catalasegens]GJM54226.1 DUF5053 domain-containing protein [Capnocytophaga catalasegens]
MKTKIQELKQQYVKAKTEAEREQINAQISQLASENEQEFIEAMKYSIEDTLEKAKELSVKARLNEVLPILPLSYIAEQYFQKSKSWFYQRLNGNIVNGSPAQFTQEEIKTLNFALQDLSKKLGSISL